MKLDDYTIGRLTITCLFLGAAIVEEVTTLNFSWIVIFVTYIIGTLLIGVLRK